MENFIDEVDVIFINQNIDPDYIIESLIMTSQGEAWLYAQLDWGQIFVTVTDSNDVNITGDLSDIDRAEIFDCIESLWERSNEWLEPGVHYTETEMSKLILV